MASPYTDNQTRQAISTDVGFKVSKPGYNALTTASQNLVFSSSWPSLPIAFEATPPSGTTKVAHGLGFPPLTFYWTVDNDLSGISTVATRHIASVDSTYAYVTTGAIATDVKCFNLDLSKDTDYVLAPGDVVKTPYDNNYGIKVAKDGKTTASTDMRDYSIHSRCQSPLILAVKTQDTIPSSNVGTGIGNVVQYTTKLSYPVWVYGFIRVGPTLATSLGLSNGAYLVAPYYSQAYPRTFTDGFQSYIGYTGDDTGATLVILRDPMFASTQITAQF